RGLWGCGSLQVVHSDESSPGATLRAGAAFCTPAALRQVFAPATQRPSNFRVPQTLLLSYRSLKRRTRATRPSGQRTNQSQHARYHELRIRSAFARALYRQPTIPTATATAAANSNP